VELLEELRSLQRDLTDLGDAAAAALLARAEKCFLAWRFDDGERFMEEALIRVQESLDQPPSVPTSGVARYFDPCARAVRVDIAIQPDCRDKLHAAST
jgi:hypothetical protein